VIGWAPEPVWTYGKVKILHPTGTRTSTFQSSSPHPVAIPTALPRLFEVEWYWIKTYFHLSSTLWLRIKFSDFNFISYSLKVSETIHKYLRLPEKYRFNISSLRNQFIFLLLCLYGSNIFMLHRWPLQKERGRIVWMTDKMWRNHKNGIDIALLWNARILTSSAKLFNTFIIFVAFSTYTSLRRS
jgi:hypothetical protein